VTSVPRVLGEVRGQTAEDPLGPDDPLEVARLVRRALAAAGRRAIDVEVLVLVADAQPDAAALARFARRALGPHGAEVMTDGAGGAGLDHDGRSTTAATRAGGHLRGGVGIAIARGPGDTVTVRGVAR
jgi:hypothetical protein